jgi:hypothetical protein
MVKGAIQEAVFETLSQERNALKALKWLDFYIEKFVKFTVFLFEIFHLFLILTHLFSNLALIYNILSNRKYCTIIKVEFPFH